MVNKEVLVYSRTNNGDGTINVADIAKGAIRIYGSSGMTNINASPMIFSTVAALALPIVEIKAEGDDEGVSYEGVNNKYEIGGSIVKLPTDPAKLLTTDGQLYGCDCAYFSGPGGQDFPSGSGFGQKGSIFCTPAAEAEIEALPSTEFFILQMNTDLVDFGGDDIVGGVPFFFQLHGAYEAPLSDTTGDPNDVSKDVISITENSAAPDYCHSASTATVVLYNKGGKYDFLKTQQSGITISWGWNGEQKKTFLGLTVSASSKETKGKELMEVQCYDYMYILKNTPVINSPFYDGMISYYAIQDLAKRAGITAIKNKFQDEEVYFLPSSYTFTKPVARFESQQSIFDCIKWCAEKDQSIFYFNENGELIIELLPGGMFSVGGSVVAEFVKDPDGDDNMIINEKNLSSSLESTSNFLSVFTLSRDTRAPIIKSIIPSSISGVSDPLLFRKGHFYDKPALGDASSAVLWVMRAGLRLFYPIRKTNVTTVGAQAAVAKPLDFVSVDGDMFRVTSVNSHFNADNNEITCSYECEWNGGA